MNRWLKLGLQALSLLIFALIIWWAGPAAWEAVLSGNRQLLLVALGLFGVAGIASATRLRLMTHALHQRQTVPWRRYFHANWVARSFGLVLPRSLSAVGGKSVALRSFDVPLKRSVWIVMVDNLFDVLLLAATCLPAFFFLRGDLSAAWFLAAVLLVLLLSATGVWVAGSAVWQRRLTGWIRHIPWLQHKLNLDDPEALLLLPRPVAGMKGVAWTILLNLVLVAGFYFIARSVGTEADALLFLAAYPFVQLSLVASVTPGGLGLFDLGWLGLLTLGGVPEEQALTFVIAQRAYVTVFVLIWTGVALTVSLAPLGQVKARLHNS